MMPSATYASGLSFLIGATLLVGLSVGCDDAPCEDTLTCDVGDSASTSSGTGGASSSSSSQTTSSTGGGGDTGVDTTPPTVLSVTPSVDATGVSNSATILVSFSEPMNRVATQNAFQSTTLTGLTFAWPDDQTMEVTPGNLTYAQGGHDVVANQYSYTITTLAADLAGNQLEDNGTWSFSTLRSVDDALPTLEERTTNSAGVPNDCFAFPSSRIGRNGTHDCRAVVTFDLSVIPSNAEIQSARLGCLYLSLVGPTPVDSTVSRISYPFNTPAVGYSAPPVETFLDPYGFGPPTSVQNPFDIDVRSGVLAEIANSSTTIQYRVQISPDPMFGNNYLVWRDGVAQVGGCRDGLRILYTAP